MVWMFRNFWPLLRLMPVRNRMQSRANSAGSFDSTCDRWIIPFFPCYQFCQESSLLGTSLFWPDIVESWTLLLPHTPCLVFSCLHGPLLQFFQVLPEDSGWWQEEPFRHWDLDFRAYFCRITLRVTMCCGVAAWIVCLYM
jgi:hypothetical protein